MYHNLDAGGIITTTKADPCIVMREQFFNECTDLLGFGIFIFSEARSLRLFEIQLQNIDNYIKNRITGDIAGKLNKRYCLDVVEKNYITSNILVGIVKAYTGDDSASKEDLETAINLANCWFDSAITRLAK